MTPTFATIGASVVWFGLADADGRVNTPVGTNPQGVPIFERAVPQGFFLVVEQAPGPSNRDVGKTTFDWSPSDPNQLPDFRIVSSRVLGNGSATVCDVTPPNIGGVPAVDPPVFGGSQAVANAINDFACRFDSRSNTSDACTRNQFGEFQFVTPGTRVVQFCSSIGVGQELAFPAGETKLTARGTDVLGQPGIPSSIIVRITGN